MYLKTFLKGTTAERYKGYLENLPKIDAEIKFVIHDGLFPHISHLVKDYVESIKGKLKVFQFPWNSHELNPGEWLLEKL